MTIQCVPSRGLEYQISRQTSPPMHPKSLPRDPKCLRLHPSPVEPQLHPAMIDATIIPECSSETIHTTPRLSFHLSVRSSIVAHRSLNDSIHTAGQSLDVACNATEIQRLKDQTVSCGSTAEISEDLISSDPERRPGNRLVAKSRHLPSNRKSGSGEGQPCSG